jgi:hypothetical protein
MTTSSCPTLTPVLIDLAPKNWVNSHSIIRVGHAQTRRFAEVPAIPADVGQRDDGLNVATKSRVPPVQCTDWRPVAIDVRLVCQI